MAITFNERDVASEPLARGVARKRLLTDARVAGTKVWLDRIELAPAAEFAIDVGAADLAWFQVLDGRATLSHAEGTVALGPSHIVFLPPAFRAALSTSAGAAASAMASRFCI